MITTTASKQRMRSIQDKGYIIINTDQRSGTENWVRGLERVRGLDQKLDIRRLMKEDK